MVPTSNTKAFNRMKNPPHPWLLLEHLVRGKLAPEHRSDPGPALYMLLQTDLSYIRRCRNHHFEEYSDLLNPIYKALRPKNPAEEKLSQVHDPDFTPYLSKKEKKIIRYFLPAVTPDVPSSSRDTDEEIYRFVIEGEVNRLIGLIDRLPDPPDLDADPELAYDFRNLIDFIDHLITLEREKQNAGGDIFAASIHRILKKELIALQAELQFRFHKEDLSRLDDISREKLMKTEAWYEHQIKTILDNWTAKYKRRSTAETFLKLFLMMEDEQEDAPSYTKSVQHHVEIILYLIVIEHIHTDAVKAGVYSYNNALKQLRLTDNILTYGGRDTVESKKVFTWLTLLEQADAAFHISQSPLVKERMERLQNILRHAFSEKISESQLPQATEKSASSMTAIEQLQQDFLTVPELADYFGVTDDTIRKNLKRYDISTIPFGGSTLVSYKEYREKLESGK